MNGTYQSLEYKHAAFILSDFTNHIGESMEEGVKNLFGIVARTERYELEVRQSHGSQALTAMTLSYFKLISFCPRNNTKQILDALFHRFPDVVGKIGKYECCVFVFEGLVSAVHACSLSQPNRT